MKSYVTALALCLLCTLGVFVFVQHKQQIPPAPVLQSSSAAPGLSSPATSTAEPSSGDFDYGLPTVGLSDAALNLEAFRNKPTLVYVFLATCPHCRAFYPTLESLVRKYSGQGLQSVMLCGSRSSKLEIEDFKSTLNPSLPMIQDVDKAFQQKYTISMIPTVFLVNAQGRYQRYEFNQLHALDSALSVLMAH